MPIPTVESNFVDTHVWVNATVLTAPLHAHALSAISGISPANLWTSRQVIREFLAVLSRPQTFFSGNAPTAELLDRARLIESRSCVAEDGPTVTDRLHDLLRFGGTRGKQIHDANIVATMLAHGIRTVLTSNVSDFSRFGHLIAVRALAPA